MAIEFTEQQKKDLLCAWRVARKQLEHTTCPDPVDGGCIGGPVPGYGCFHEAAQSLINSLDRILNTAGYPSWQSREDAWQDMARR